MCPSVLPRRLLEARLNCNPSSGCIPVWQKLLDRLNLPTISDLLVDQRVHRSLKTTTRHLLNIQSHLSLSNDCSSLPIGACDLLIGKPAPHWAATLSDVHKTRRNNFRIRLLTGCDGLEADVSRFRTRQNGRFPNDPSYKICGATLENPLYFVASCPALQDCRSRLLGDAPSPVKACLPSPARDPDRFLDVALGVDWVDDNDVQSFLIDFLDKLRSHRNSLTLTHCMPITYPFIIIHAIHNIPYHSIHNSTIAPHAQIQSPCAVTIVMAPSLQSNNQKSLKLQSNASAKQPTATSEPDICIL